MNASLVGFAPSPGFARFASTKSNPAPAIRRIQEYVVGFAFSEDLTKVALIRKAQPAWQAGKLNGVGGKIEPGEVPEDAMVREFREETGVSTSPWDWENFLVVRGDASVVHFFRAFIDVSECRTVEKEPIEIVPTYPVPSDVIANLHWAIPLALDTIEPFTVFDNGGAEIDAPSRLSQLFKGRLQ